MHTENKNPLMCDPETGICEIPTNTSQSKESLEVSNENPIKVIYFTDPICSSCWGIEPQLRKLKLEYGHLIEFEYRMGGLLPDWNYNSGSISKPMDVAKHWDEVSKHYEMPIDGDIWVEDPLFSSYPPSIAFKAAQLIDDTKSIEFLRILRESLFLEKQNITRWPVVEKAALKAGYDTELFFAKYTNGQAEEEFKKDLALSQNLGVRGFPTLFFTANNETEMIYGSQPYSNFEEVIQRLLNTNAKSEINLSVADLLKHFRTLAPKELAVILNKNYKHSVALLEDLVSIGLAKIIKSKNGNLYQCTQS